MSNVKVNLSILLQGGTMLSVEESTRIAKDGTRVIDTHKHNKFELEVMDRGKKKTIKVFTRKNKPVKQVMRLSEEAYEYMVGSEIPPKYKGVWKGLKLHEKLRWHCQQIADSMGGTVYDIQVLD